MPDKYFLDTNIFVYCFDQTAPVKQRRAQGLIHQALTDHSGVISNQVIQEFFNVATRKFQPAMTRSEASRYLETVLAPLCEVFSSVSLSGGAEHSGRNRLLLLRLPDCRRSTGRELPPCVFGGPAGGTIGSRLGDSKSVCAIGKPWFRRRLPPLLLPCRRLRCAPACSRLWL